MTTSSNKQIVEQVFNDVINGRNLTIVEKLIAPGFINHGIPDSGHGPEGFKEVIELFTEAFPDLHIHIQNVLGEGDFVATRGYWTGTHRGFFMGIPATGKKARVDFIDFWKIADSRAIENWVQMDMEALMTQLGVITAHEEA